MSAALTQIVIDVDPGAAPISGRVCADGVAPQSFTGWTGLFAVLRSLAADDGGATKPRQPERRR